MNRDGYGRDPPIIQCVNSYNEGDEKSNAKRYQILKLLVHYGARVNIQSLSVNKGPPKATAVVLAAWRGLYKCVEFLVESGADLNIPTELGDTALMMAIRSGNTNCAKYLIKHMSVSMLDQRNDFGETALMAAASRETVRNSTLHQLLNAEVNIHTQNEKGYTALMFALQRHCVDPVGLLLEKGALITTVSPKGETLLTVAEYQHIPRLLNQGLDPTSSRRDQNTIHPAVRTGRNAAVRALVMSGFPPLELQYCGLLQSRPVSPLAVACLYRRPDIAKYFVLNHYLTRYDIVRLPWEPQIRQFLHSTTKRTHCTNGDADFRANMCLEILDFLSSRPHSLRYLCVITITSRLSLDFSTVIPDTPEDRDKWLCSPTFRERLESLELSLALKKQILHQTSSSAICCLAWDDIILGNKISLPSCNCKHCDGQEDWD
ncbi:ankyrin repeat domain-containing protein 17 [Elysia marginata]|uniref:Ankyrin repeat domain-containing protein 17 n=1 Tax=Elysia marginata TaxID=1093978 RepID=A0AAV4J9X5_9GAST|nr:ankyrin repeat domain-containing protein 17 [Elysia marginata]